MIIPGSRYVVQVDRVEPKMWRPQTLSDLWGTPLKSKSPLLKPGSVKKWWGLKTHYKKKKRKKTMITGHPYLLLLIAWSTNTRAEWLVIAAIEAWLMNYLSREKKKWQKVIFYLSVIFQKARVFCKSTVRNAHTEAKYVRYFHHSLPSLCRLSLCAAL